jgi:hypothetical protein
MKDEALARTRANMPTNAYPIIEIRDGWGLADTQYYSRHSNGDIISEILPVTQDTSGNWGGTADGLQLSLRFRCHEFLQKEQVVAIIILRNLSSASRGVNAGDERDYQFTIHCGTNTLVWKQEYNGGSDYGSPFQLGGNTEGVNVVWLNRLFDLSQFGKYALQVQTTVLASDGMGLTNIVSGTATFEIVEKLSPSAVAERNAQAEELNAARNGKTETIGTTNGTR